MGPVTDTPTPVSDEGLVERVAVALQLADVEQFKWGRCIMPTDVAQYLARAAIQAMDQSK